MSSHMKIYFKSYPVFISLIFIFSVLLSCEFHRAELGSEKNPIKLHFVPSIDNKVLDANSKIFKDYLEKNTPYKYEIQIPQSYVAVVESFGTKRADVAGLNSFGYYLAHKKYGVEARMTVIRHGLPTYQSQFITRADSSIKTLKDLEGKRMAFVDPASASGYLLPLKTLRDRKINLKETFFAMKHDSVVTKVYKGEVDAGATFYSPPVNGKIDDARRLVLVQYPDVEKKVKIIELSKPIPNDPIVFRKDLPEEMKVKVADAFISFISTPEGKKAFDEIYGLTELKKSSDEDYAEMRKMFDDLKDITNQMIN